MDDRTEYVLPPEVRGESMGSIWVVGAVALIALFTLAGLYVAHYSLKGRIDAAAKEASAEHAKIQAKLDALQKRVEAMERKPASVPVATATPLATEDKSSEPDPEPASLPARRRPRPRRVRVGARAAKKLGGSKVKLKKGADEESPLFNPYD